MGHGAVVADREKAEAGPSTPLKYASLRMTVSMRGSTSQSSCSLLLVKVIAKAIGSYSASYQPKIYAKISGATIDASDSMMNFGVSSPNLPQVIFSLGTAPE